MCWRCHSLSAPPVTGSHVRKSSWVRLYMAAFCRLMLKWDPVFRDLEVGLVNPTCSKVNCHVYVQLFREYSTMPFHASTLFFSKLYINAMSPFVAISSGFFIFSSFLPWDTMPAFLYPSFVTCRVRYNRGKAYTNACASRFRCGAPFGQNSITSSPCMTYIQCTQPWFWAYQAVCVNLE